MIRAGLADPDIRYPLESGLLMKSSRNTTCFNHSLEQLMPIISLNDKGSVVLTLPGFLRGEQRELEQMLNRVFANKLDSGDNLALAEQLSLNWCVSKAKQTGLTEKCRCQ